MEFESIGKIPLNRRGGEASSLFFLWFSSNMQLTTIVTGALALTLRIPLYSALIGILLGNVLGGILMALHSAQGPHMPAPQMILTRAQFGLFGNTLPTAVFTLMYIGFYATTSVIGGQILSQFFHLPYGLALVCINAFTVLLVYVGDQVVRTFQRYSAFVFLLTFFYLTLHLWTRGNVFSVTPFNLSIPAVLEMAGVAITWQVSYTPYVSDYSRRLHPDSPMWKLALYSGMGTMLSTTWMMGLGATAAWSGVANDEIGNGTFLLIQVPKFLHIPMDMVFLLGIVVVNSFNLYGSFMSSKALFPGIRHQGRRQRLVNVVALALLCTGISLWGQNNFLMKYSAFLSYLLYFLIPWSAISLVDFYGVSKAEYSIDRLLWKSSGQSRFHWETLTVYILSLLLEFIAMAFSHWFSWGQTVSSLAWAIGFLSSSLLYLLSINFAPQRQFLQ